MKLSCSRVCRFPYVFFFVVFVWSDAFCAQTVATSTCSVTGVGSAKLVADAPVTIVSVSTETASRGAISVPYCLVKLRIPQAINIWVGLPVEGKWNGRLRSEGSGGYGGFIDVPTESILDGYVGVKNDTGHRTENDEGLTTWGSFGMLAPGVPNTVLQKDFASRSQHLMAVLGKQVVQAFYGRNPDYSYWFGCSEGGREGLRIAQEFPDDYDGIVAGAPAIYWSRLAASQIWPQVVMRELTGGVISAPKLNLATASAVAACDKLDEVEDGVLTDPRECDYHVKADTVVTKSSCSPQDDSCLSPAEAEAVDRIWQGPSTASGRVLWRGVEKGAALTTLAGQNPIVFAVNQPKFWVYLNPNWSWQDLTLRNYEEFFLKSRATVDPTLASESTDLSEFRRRGGKILSWHGLGDSGIPPGGTIKYYQSVVKHFSRDYANTKKFFRLFLAPGVEHCGGGNGPQPQPHDLMNALVRWVEKNEVPDRIVASQLLSDGATRRRPLCPFPEFARFTGRGSTDDANSFVCRVQ